MRGPTTIQPQEPAPPSTASSLVSFVRKKKRYFSKLFRVKFFTGALTSGSTFHCSVKLLSEIHTVFNFFCDAFLFENTFFSITFNPTTVGYHVPTI